MAGFKDGFKRGTHKHRRMQMQAYGDSEPARVAAVLAAAAVKITALMRCQECGHIAADHDMDRTVLLPGDLPGGEGCVHGWEPGQQGCRCVEFKIAGRDLAAPTGNTR